ncbi:T-cell surface glycoprotein CD1b-3 [Camelus dromedarius]|uniref:T-cell surface glycoprotein CD1b-3 n=1 Tax=Camelus dromedarius TaxID=9838 RepID=A0A5N4CMR7_CAMDR|nr:T-cell surface glycoprotein CD1b-3 [Camelus dromedarius]
MRGEREQQGTQEKRLCASCRRDVVSSVVLGSGSQRGTWPELPVGHSSLGDQDIVLYWGHRSSVGWIFLAVTVPLLLLAVHILGSDAVEFLCLPSTPCRVTSVVFSQDTLSTRKSRLPLE